MINLLSRDLIKIPFKELFDDVKSALILKGVLSPMNSMFKLNCRYDIEMNEADFGALLTKRSHVGCISLNASVMPSSNFVDFIHCVSRICLGQNVKALVWRRKQICPLKPNIFTLKTPISTNEVSMLKLAIEVCFENHFGSIHAIFLSLGSSKSVYFFLGHPVEYEAPLHLRKSINSSTAFK